MMSRMMLIGMLAGMTGFVAERVQAQVDVRLPFIRVQTGPDGVRVRAPFVRVETDRNGTRVRAPFTRVRTYRSRYPYSASEQVLPRPDHIGLVLVEVPLGLKVIVPEARAPLADPLPSPARRTDSKSRRRSRSGQRSSPDDLTTDLGEPAPIEEAFRETEKAAPPDQAKPDDVKPPEPNPPSSPSASKNAPPTQQSPPSPDASPETAPPSVSAKSVVSYLVIPLEPNERVPSVRIQILPPESKVAATSSDPRLKPYKLEAMWHGEVSSFFQPVAGLHLFAFIHPYSLQPVCVQVVLPEGHPRLKIKRDEVEFDYGRYEAEIHFLRDGRVFVKQ